MARVARKSFTLSPNITEEAKAGPDVSATGVDENPDAEEENINDEAIAEEGTAPSDEPDLTKTNNRATLPRATRKFSHTPKRSSST